MKVLLEPQKSITLFASCISPPFIIGSPGKAELLTLTNGVNAFGQNGNECSEYGLIYASVNGGRTDLILHPTYLPHPRSVGLTSKRPR